jgi:alanyl-tRNA synthetase
MTSAEIRQQFFDFFRARGHEIVPSAPIVIKNDPTLMFTNAGMNQFKDYFLGNRPAPFKRVADTQKCLRVSGKHNDLEEVGVDTYHHTMFEMLGNWSFGDYFKSDAIKWSWELLTSVYKIPKDRLYVTIFEGDEKEKLPRDEEAYKEWKKWIDEDRILPFGKKDNFWEMGDTGPCGPCTEIHVDTRSEEERKKMNGRDFVNRDNPEVIEIWNNVFIQFNRLKNGSLEPLPSKHVDTGMGLERLVRVLQNKHSNYDTDVFSGLINEIEKITGQKYEGSGSKKDVAFRVLADHVRAIAFTIADGQLPSNTGAGYVIRRILRRAVTYYNSYLGYKMNPLLYELVPTLANQFEKVFPELHQQADFVRRVIKEEEESFLQTLYLGMAIFNSYMNEGLRAIEENREHFISLGSKKFQILPQKVVSGEFAFELKDTYGFPIDLTSLIAGELGWTVDMKGFDKSLEEQKDRSRAATAIDTEDWVVLAGSPGKEKMETAFVGYDNLDVQTKATRYRKVKMKGKEAVQIVLEQTPFYAESGGQVGDTGHLSFEGERVTVLDTKKENDLIIHYTDRLPVNITGIVTAQVDAERRKKTAIHHSATHLLHAALRAVLGPHVAQKGSLVNSEHLRFDFSHFAKMTDEEILRVEQMVNEKIRENIPVVIKLLPKEEALQMGAMALFGEKYGDVVRVVIIDPTYSIELCGGTHVGATGELGIMKILHESAVAAGVRRIEAVSGEAAEHFISEQLSSLRNIREALKQPKDVARAVENLLQENSEARKQVEKLEARQLQILKDELLKRKTKLDGISFIGEIVEVNNADALKKLCFDLKSELKNYAVVLAANIGGKPQVAVMLDESVSTSKNLEAPKIIKEQIAPLIKGGGGGQKTLATAGGQDASNLQQVIDKVKGLFL